MTVSTLERKEVAALAGCTRAILLTDLDREGTVLASRFLRKLVHENIKVSLRERLRLKAGSRGVFLHVEDLGRFATPEGAWEPAPTGPTTKQGRSYRQGLGRLRRPRATD